MQMVLSLLAALLLICSFAGYMLLVKQRLGLHSAFIPIFVFSGIACAVYFFGLLGGRMLLAGAVAILLAGVACFIWALRGVKKGARLFHVAPTLFGMVWAIGSAVFFLLLARTHLIHYDNFSHWALVVKQMLSTNAFPTASSALIDFKNYPLGVSSFVYYVSRFIGQWEPVMLCAQGLLIFGCFYAIFGIISEKKRFLLYAFLGLGCATLSLFNLTIRINNLLVDFLLPVLTLAVFAIAHQYRTDAKRALLTALPLLALLTITKNTGILFAVLGMAFLVYTLLTHRGELSARKLTGSIIATTLLAALPYTAWSIYMNVSFKGVENKFDTQQIALLKTDEQMSEITNMFLRAVTDLSSRPVLGIIVFNLLAIVACLVSAVVLKKKLKLWKALLALDVVLLLYYVGICAMYVYLMPWDEAVRLAGFERYASSIVILFVGGLILAAVVELENSFYYRIGTVESEKAFYSAETKKRYQTAVIVCVAVSVVLLLSEYNGMLHNLKSYPDSLPYTVKQITGDRWYGDGVEDTRNYLLYAPDEDAQVTNYYLQYVGRYYLYAPNVDGVCCFYEDNMDILLRGYDYLVVVQPDAEEQALLREHYGVDGNAGIYRIEAIGSSGVALHFESSDNA